MPWSLQHIELGTFGCEAVNSAHGCETVKRLFSKVSRERVEARQVLVVASCSSSACSPPAVVHCCEDPADAAADADE